MIVNLIGQARIFYAMGRDGLLPPTFSRVHARTATPWLATIVTGVLAALIAGILPLGLLGELVSIGTLLAFAVVCGGVLVLRARRPEEPRPFRVPFSPWIPLLGIGSCVGLMLALPADTWIRLLVWLAIGALIYFFYGMRHSLLRNTLPHRGSSSRRDASAEVDYGA
jgi:APA family basic amino acid/polyamine antiporter